MAYRVFGTNTKEQPLADTDKFCGQGYRPFPPEDLAEKKCLEPGLTVQTFVDGMFDPFGDVNLAAGQFFRQFILASG